MRACVRACVRVCMRVCVHVHDFHLLYDMIVFVRFTM